ncbi:MAG TPA: cyclohexanecarboxylate-CoA ligase, partial [Brevibacterium sp.]|nr:cyclohexanecarboxylate-CoA ligase [Brevibacterium sp.]
MPTTFDTRLTEALIEQHTATGAWKDRLLLDHLEEWAQRTPDEPAIRDPYGAHTYARLRADVDSAARALV